MQRLWNSTKEGETSHGSRGIGKWNSDFGNSEICEGKQVAEEREEDKNSGCTPDEKEAQAWGRSKAISKQKQVWF